MPPNRARPHSARIFCDLSLDDYFNLAAASERVIRESLSTNFSDPILVVQRSLYYPFAIFASHTNTGVVDDATRAVLQVEVDRRKKLVFDALTNSNGAMDCLLLYFTDMAGRDYRVPLMVALPPNPPRPQAHILAERLIERARGIQPRGAA